MKRVAVPERGAEALYGTRDENLRFLEDSLKVRIKSQGSELMVEGEEDGEQTVVRIFEQLVALMKDGYSVSAGDVRLAAQLLRENGTARLRDYLMRSAVRGGRKTVVPRSMNQRVYLEEIEKHDMVFGIGPAGTGKTYLAVAQAVQQLIGGSVDRLILSRPAVEAGERLGFLPGDMKEKVDPYLRPLYDALYDMLPTEQVERRIASGEIEIAPIAFMRGRTLSDAFIILDEAQNTTPAQMKMFLTRFGMRSRMVICGDPSQVDLPEPGKSGLHDAVARLEGIPRLSMVRFGAGDVVRHPLVGRIVEAYESRAHD